MHFLSPLKNELLAELPSCCKAGVNKNRFGKKIIMAHFVDLLCRVDVDAVEDVGDDDDGHDDTDGGLRDRTNRQAGRSQWLTL